MSHPRVSIGLPVYNGEQFLADALDALLAQTYTDFEIVISDNSSTDATESICRGYQARDSRVKYHRYDVNRGVGWNFKHVFELSTGEYFKWSSHDDLHAPTFLERCVEVLDHDPEVVWCAPQTMTIDSAGKPFLHESHELMPTDAIVDGREIHRFDAGQSSPRCHERYLSVLIRNRWVHDTFGLIRASALRQTAIYRRFVGAEKTMLTELCLIGRFEEIPEVLFQARLHRGRVSESATVEQRNANMIPQRKGRTLVPHPVQAALAQLHVIYKADISLIDRMFCLSALARYLLQFRKWRKIGGEIWQSFAPQKNNVATPSPLFSEEMKAVDK